MAVVGGLDWILSTNQRNPNRGKKKKWIPPRRSQVNHRRTFWRADSINNLTYWRCNHSIWDGIGTTDDLPKPWYITLLRLNSTTPCSGLTLADNSNKPSEERTSRFSGESPHRNTIRSSVFSNTSKWSVTWVPTSYVELRSCRGVQSWCAVFVPWYLRARYSRWMAYPGREEKNQRLNRDQCKSSTCENHRNFSFILLDLFLFLLFFLSWLTSTTPNPAGKRFDQPALLCQ